MTRQDQIRLALEAYIECGTQLGASRITGVNRLTIRHNIERIRLIKNNNFTPPENVMWKARIEKAERKHKGVRYL